MNEIRTLIQSTLSTISNLQCGAIIEENMVQNGVTYFGYELNTINQGGDFNNNYTMQVSLTGYLVRKINANENTLEIIDTTLESIKEKLKSLNFKYSYNDISSYTDGFQKIQVTGNVKYNELNNILL